MRGGDEGDDVDGGHGGAYSSSGKSANGTIFPNPLLLPRFRPALASPLQLQGLGPRAHLLDPLHNQAGTWLWSKLAFH